MDIALTRLLWNKTGYLLRGPQFLDCLSYFLAIIVVDDQVRKYMMSRVLFCWPSRLEGLYHQAYCTSHQAGIPLAVFVKGIILNNEILRTGSDLNILVEGYLTKIILADV